MDSSDDTPPASGAPNRLRRLTVQEAAALQTFDPSWQFRGPQVAQFRQMIEQIEAQTRRRKPKS